MCWNLVKVAIKLKGANTEDEIIVRVHLLSQILRNSKVSGGKQTAPYLFKTPPLANEAI